MVIFFRPTDRTTTLRSTVRTRFSPGFSGTSSRRGRGESLGGGYLAQNLDNVVRAALVGVTSVVATDHDRATKEETHAPERM